MSKSKLAQGVVHEIPDDLREMLSSTDELSDLWNGLTPLARNEWICWMSSAKKMETRIKRIEWMRTDLLKGKRRPCCWPGCSHR